MSKLLLAKLGAALACQKTVILQEKELPPFWSKTPSNLAYRLRKITGWNIKGKKLKATGRIQFQRLPHGRTKTKTNT